LLTGAEIAKFSAADTNAVLRAVLSPDGTRTALDASRALVPVNRAGFYRAENSAGETNVLFAANLSNLRECRTAPSETLPLRSKQPLTEIKEGFRLGFEPWVVLAFLAAALTLAEWVLFHRRVIE
jgi:hypothetical protein